MGCVGCKRRVERCEAKRGGMRMEGRGLREQWCRLTEKVGVVQYVGSHSGLGD